MALYLGGTKVAAKPTVKDDELAQADAELIDLNTGQGVSE